MSFSSSFPSNSYESDEEKDVPATLNPNASEPARPASRATSASAALHQDRVTQIDAEHERVNEEQRILDEEERLLELQEAQAALQARRLALQQRRYQLGQQTASLPPALDTSTALAAAVATPVRPAQVNNASAVLGDGGDDLPDGDGYLPAESGPQSSATVNNVQPSSGCKQFNYDGRHVLTAPEKQLLLKESYYRCYEQHTFGRHIPRCSSKPVQKAAPRPLN